MNIAKNCSQCTKRHVFPLMNRDGCSASITMFELGMTPDAMKFKKSEFV